ncbi:MAG: transglycosylase SLT domain-containing protein [Candidatus Micrarchaeota archaeon]|nr:transglycosylase SLT domain-containing protein [Candidatus Micrarchaeota archaeon]
MSGLLKKVVASVLFPGAIIAATMFSPPHQHSGSTKDGEKPPIENVCRQHSPSDVIQMFPDPNGVCEENPPEETQENCPQIPVADASFRKSPKMIVELLEKCPSKAQHILSEAWVTEYMKGTHANVIPESLLRTLNSGQFYNAVMGFRKGLAEREAQTGKPLPEDIREMFLALSFTPVFESNWSNRCSPRKACGPYQFTRQTAKKYGLVKEYRDHHGKLVGITDNRHKNYDSARAAAHLLYDLYISFGGDMNLALSAYNSGQPWKYASFARKANSPISYQGYLSFLAAQARSTNRGPDIRDIVENANYVPKALAVLKIIKEQHPEFVLFAAGKISYEKLRQKALAGIPCTTGKCDIKKIKDIRAKGQGKPQYAIRETLTKNM